MAKKKSSAPIPLAGYIPAQQKVPVQNQSNSFLDRDNREILTEQFKSRTILTEQFKTAVLIGATNSVSNGTATIYTVPTGKVLLLISITNQISYNALTYGNAGYLIIDGTTIMRGYGSATAGAYVLGQNLNAIIVLTAGKVIGVTTASADVTSTGTIFGYLIDSSEYYQAI